MLPCLAFLAFPRSGSEEDVRTVRCSEISVFAIDISSLAEVQLQRADVSRCIDPRFLSLFFVLPHARTQTHSYLLLESSSRPIPGSSYPIGGNL